MTMRSWGIAVALALGLTACQKPTPVDLQAQARAVSVVRVAQRPIAGGLTASGTLIPRNDVAVSADLAGYRVSRVLVEEGAWVRAGQPLAEMDASILRSQLDQQLSLVAQQKATADQREAEASRVTGLDGQGVLSQEQLDARRFAAKTARAAANAQLAAAREIETRLAHLTLRSPVSGLVIERTVQPGAISGGSATPWFRVAENGQVELSADVAEADFAQIHPGLSAQVTFSNESTADGTVRLVSPRVDSNTKLGKVRVSLPVRADIRAGGFAKASFVDMTRAVPALPETAIRYDANGASVMVVAQDGKVSQQSVRTGQRGGGYVELLTGPPVGSVVVSKAGAQLLPGDVVKPDWGPAGGGQ
ncbi:MAG: efflux RND transporter periplasmic adaptor subunit [Caulobacterales bacterium]